MPHGAAEMAAEDQNLGRASILVEHHHGSLSQSSVLLIWSADGVFHVDLAVDVLHIERHEPDGGDGRTESRMLQGW